jgi:hypothetical protein
MLAAQKPRLLPGRPAPLSKQPAGGLLKGPQAAFSQLNNGAAVE